MSLIKCVKCGEEYSNNLDTCPHCNFKPELYICPECNSICKRNDQSCWKCGNPLNNIELLPADSEMLCKVYNSALETINNAKTLKDWENLCKIFTLLGNYHDAESHKALCEENYNKIMDESQKQQDYTSTIEKIDSCNKYDELAKLIKSLDKFEGLEDVDTIRIQATDKWRELTYNEACKRKKYLEAKVLFDSLGDYKDSVSRSIACATMEEARKKKIRKIVTISSIAVAVIIAVILIVTMYVIPKGHYDDGVAAYKKDNYTVALEHLYAANGFSNSEKLISKCHYELGKACITDEDYQSAKEHFQQSKGYRDSKQYLSYSKGMIKFNNGNYSAAYYCFDDADNLLDSKKMLTACDLMEAEECYDDGDLSYAKDLFSELPKDFSYNGISVKDRLSLLEKNQEFIDIAGEWDSDSGYMEVRQTHDSTGIWHNWYSEDPDGELNLKCTIQDNGKVHIEGTVKFWKYTEYSSLETVVSSGEYYDTAYIDETVSSLPCSFSVDSNTKLTISPGTAELHYYEVAPDEDVYFTYLYKTDMTYKK